jgi:1-deoxy-D-xylulose-5-phosphate synthase
MAVAGDLKGAGSRAVAVIGDRGLSAGLAYEAMNNAGTGHSRLIVVLNDSETSVAQPVGAMSSYLSRLVSSRPYLALRGVAKAVAARFPGPLEEAMRRAEEMARGFVGGGTLFEELGFYYVGPIDGHSLDHLLPVLVNLRDAPPAKPVLLHVVTHKGRGLPAAPVRLGIASAGAPPPSHAQVFADALIAAAERDPRLVAITAATATATGMDRFARRFPRRCFDVGMAEQHAVAFAAGLAAEGMRPFCVLPAAFLRRGYDQVVHDVARLRRPVRFAIDGAGLGGAEDGGVLDLNLLAAVPDFVLMAPSDEGELARMVATAAAIDDRPSAIRYARGPGLGAAPPQPGETLPIGRARLLREGAHAAILTLGERLSAALAAADALVAQGIALSIADARFAKPLDRALVLQLARGHPALITVEDGMAGGFGAAVAQLLAEAGVFDRGLRFRAMTLPDRFLAADAPERRYALAGLDARAIEATVLAALGRAAESGSARA